MSLLGKVEMSPWHPQAVGMQEGPLLMTQADRDRLVTLKKAKKKLITQREAAEELGLSVRHVKRLLYELKRHGDKTVNSRAAREVFESENRGEDRAGGGDDLVGAGVPRVQ